MITFESSNLFCHLPTEALERLEAHAQELHFAAQEPIFEKGDPGDGLYLLQSGEVEISDTEGLGERRVLSRVTPGEVFGEMAVLDGQPRSACAAAAAETTVRFVPSEEILCLMEEHPELALKFLREISGRLREFNRQQLHRAA